MENSSTNDNLKNQTEQNATLAENHKSEPQDHLEETEHKPIEVRDFINPGVIALVISSFAFLCNIWILYNMIETHKNWDGTGEDVAGWGLLILLPFASVALPAIIVLFIGSITKYIEFSKSKSLIKKSTKISIFIIYTLIAIFSSPMLIIVGWFIIMYIT